jgi:hypothetical protein
MKRTLTILVLIAMLLVYIPASARESDLKTPNPAKVKAGVYIVQLAENPVVAYEGGISGLRATKPPKGQKINPNSSAVRKYATYLDSRHNAVLNAVGAGSGKIYDYRYAINGFAAVLTPAQVEKLQAQPGVLRVWNDELRRAATENSPGFLGLTDSEVGLRAKLGLKGEDIVIGVIDSGIWPEHPSFSDQTDLADRPGSSGKRTRAYGPPPSDWYGTCQSGEQWSQDDCNYKLIGARYFLDGYGHHGIIAHDYKSARDADGHGSHTASTAGGNEGVQATLFGVNRGVISGMAPRARLAVYKALWNDGSGYESDLAKAIDAAVADGVDVINYSIGSDAPGFLAADDIAFLFAADAGVFVATSAGNAGPGAGTIGSPSADPWVITVGASTQNRTFQGSVTLSNGPTFSGPSVTGSTGMLPLVDSVSAGSELCLVGELDPAVVAGKIVLCKRGVNARVDKSLAVLMAGGAGMVLYNAADTQSLNADSHWVPSVHITFTDGSAVKAYIDANLGTATARITGGVRTTIPAPWMADFSSRGPNLAAPDIIKPDITAPGVNILAANTPTPSLGATGQLFQVLGGTSMSSPHIAGIGALLKEEHPDWTPAMIKSALMTTAYQDVLKEDGATPADPFDKGAGHVAPNPAVDPGLVYDAGILDYLAFLCGSSSAVGPNTCAALASLGYPFDPSDLNLPSIGIHSLAGIQTVTREVTNVGSEAATYTASWTLPGIDVTVTPGSLTLPAGGSAAFEVTFTRTAAPLGEYVFGELVWSDGVHSVRSPIVVRPVPIAAPAQVSGSGDPISYDVTFGYTGAFSASARGLIPAVSTPGSVVDDPTNTFSPDGPGVTAHVVAIPPGTNYARFSLFDDFTDGSDDLDLYVYFGNNLVGSSGSGTSAEEVNLTNPVPGDYTVYVHGWQTDGAEANYTLFTWLLDTVDAGNMTVSAPSSAVTGASGTISLSFSGLVTATKYLGSVAYSDGANEIGSTIVRVDTP